MIVFDGMSLEAIAGVIVKDIQIGQIEYYPITRPRAIRAGSEFILNRPGTRNVVITFSLLYEDIMSRQANLMAVSQWAKTDKEYKLELPGYPNRFLKAVCTRKPEASMRQWWESRLQIVFTCYDDPYWNSGKERTVNCGKEFYVGGDAVPLMRIERNLLSDASDQSYTLDDKTISFSAIPAGQMKIDLNRQTAIVKPSLQISPEINIMQYYNINGKFLIPRTGTQIITGTGTIKYRERWQ